uniref:JmjC domain-containing protein n=1 Tax=Phaeomonas parva TaxID=124430 RepID=A0A7S1UF00_9STRA
MLALGLGVANEGALKACGAPPAERAPALAYLRLAEELAGGGRGGAAAEEVRQARDALAFCVEEEREVELWRQRAEMLRAKGVGAGAGAKVAAKAKAKAPSGSGAAAVAALRLPLAARAFIDRVARRLAASPTVARAWELWSRVAGNAVWRAVAAGATTAALRVGGVLRRLRGSDDAAAANPNPNAAGAETIADVLRREAAPVEVVEVAPGRYADMAAAVEAKCFGEGRPLIVRAAGPGADAATEGYRRALLGAVEGALLGGAAGGAAGDETVRVSFSPKGRFDGPEDAAALGLDFDGEVLVRPAAESMSLGTFVRLVAHAQECAVQGAPCELPAGMYIEYLALHQYLTASLGGGGPAFAVEAPMMVSNFWMAGNPTVSPLHYDEYDNVLHQVLGEKDVFIFPPAALPELAYHPRYRATYKYVFPDAFEVAEVGEHPVLFGSSLRLDRSARGGAGDAEARRLLALQPQVAALRPGDMLCMPAFYHHEVHSRPEEVSFGAGEARLSLNAALNNWFHTDAVFEEEQRLFGYA